MNARHALAGAEAYADAIDTRCAALMAPGASFWPLDPEHLAEALVEAKQDFFERLSAALACLDSRNATGCTVMRAESAAYWEPKAIEQAKKEIAAECREAVAAAMEDRADMRKWDADMAMVGWAGMA